MDVGMFSDVGVRDINEDSCGFAGSFFVVADGMGGAKAGEVASALAVQMLMKLADQKQGFPDSLLQALDEVNAAIYKVAHDDEACRGMGTTATMLKLVDGVAHIAHVGDSRAYLWRDSELRLLTADHTLVAELVRNGGITEDEARRHPQRHLLTRALGTEPRIKPDLLNLPVNAGDVFLLCTDGLSGVLSEGDMESILRLGLPAQQTAERLIQTACDAGGQDNLSVIVVSVSDISGARE